MCMEQISYFVTQNGDGIILGISAFTVILLAITLHKMKRMRDMMQEIDRKFATFLQREKAAVVEEPAAGNDSNPVSKEPLPQDAAELLDAVLDEVFP